MIRIKVDTPEELKAMSRAMDGPILEDLEYELNYSVPPSEGIVGIGRLKGESECVEGTNNAP